ncbi:MAG: biopolymer transporter ExbD [Myxococcota bacterium]
MGAHAKDEGELVSGINVTPLVDITLVLLVVMMVTAPLLAEARLSLRLPAATPDGVATHDPLIVEIRADGTMVVDGQRGVVGEGAVGRRDLAVGAGLAERTGPGGRSRGLR